MLNTYIIWPEMVLFYGAMPKQIVRHQHPVIQLIIGTEKPFLKKDENGSWVPHHSLLVAPNVAHECDAVDQVIFSLNIDPETRLGEQLLRTRLNDSKQSACTAEELAYFDCKKIENLIGEEQFEELYHYLQACFGTDLPRGSRLKKDERIEHIKSYISDHLEQRITSAQLCRQVFLSESRLQHLFKAEMGLPIRNYILWLRLTRALKLILKGESLTAAAHEAGFFDSAHMSKTFVRQLGINPAEIVKNSRFVQVSIMEGA